MRDLWSRSKPVWEPGINEVSLCQPTPAKAHTWKGDINAYCHRDSVGSKSWLKHSHSLVDYFGETRVGSWAGLPFEELHPFSCFTNLVAVAPGGWSCHFSLLADFGLPWTSLNFLKKFIYFIYLSSAALSLHCCTRAFSSLRWTGATLRCGARASHCGGFSCCGAQALGARASVVVACGL